MLKENSLEVNVLAGELAVDGREGVELVLEEVLILVVEVAIDQYILCVILCLSVKNFGSVSPLGLRPKIPVA